MTPDAQRATEPPELIRIICGNPKCRLCGVTQYADLLWNQDYARCVSCGEAVMVRR